MPVEHPKKINEKSIYHTKMVYHPFRDVFLNIPIASSPQVWVDKNLWISLLRFLYTSIISRIFFGGGLLTPNLLGFFVRPNEKGSETIPLSVNGLGTVGCGVSP